jgi:hypothetical protein
MRIDVDNGAIATRVTMPVEDGNNAIATMATMPSQIKGNNAIVMRVMTPGQQRQGHLRIDNGNNNKDACALMATMPSHQGQ